MHARRLALRLDMHPTPPLGGPRPEVTRRPSEHSGGGSSPVMMGGGANDVYGAFDVYGARVLVPFQRCYGS